MARSSEFAGYWREHEVGLTRRDLKRIQHPEVGILELHCQLLFDPEQSQALLVFTATPGSDSYQKLQRALGHRPDTAVTVLPMVSVRSGRSGR